MDSGATHHITANRDLLTKDQSITTRDKVNLPSGASVDISHIGDALIFEMKQ